MTDELSQEWLTFCRRGKISLGHQRRSVERSVAPDGTVRGYYSDLRLDPMLRETDSLYPSHDHTTSPRDHKAMVLDARLFNDMKSHLTEEEFWQVIEHLYAVGRAKGRIHSETARRLPSGWKPARNF